MNYGIRIRLSEPYGAVMQRVRDALKTEGFGILTEIDVQATMKAEAGRDEIAPYLILGACNPPLAHRALRRTRRSALLLPCNVVIREDGAGHHRRGDGPAGHGQGLGKP